MGVRRAVCFALVVLMACVGGPAWAQQQGGGGVPGVVTGGAPQGNPQAFGTQPAAATGGGGQAATGGAGANGETRGSGDFQSSYVSNIRRYDVRDPDQAFYGVALPVDKLYRGVIPGVRDSLPHIRRQQVAGQVSKRTSRLTWIGFQKMPDKTRIFLQTYKVPAFRVERGKREGEIVVVLQNTMIGAYNFRRLMDARWIPRSIYGIRSWRRGKDTYVSIQTRSQVEFSLSVQGNYLMLDFDDKAIEQYFFDKQKTVYDDPNTQNELRGAD